MLYCTYHHHGLSGMGGLPPFQRDRDRAENWSCHDGGEGSRKREARHFDLPSHGLETDSRQTGNGRACSACVLYDGHFERRLLIQVMNMKTRTLLIPLTDNCGFRQYILSKRPARTSLLLHVDLNVFLGLKKS